MPHHRDAALDEVVNDVGMATHTLDLHRMGAGAQQGCRRIERLVEAFARRQKRHVGHDQLRAGRATGHRARVHGHDLRGRAERILFAVHGHHHTVADEQAVDVLLGQQFGGPRIIGGHHDELAPGSFGSSEIANRWHDGKCGRTSEPHPAGQRKVGFARRATLSGSRSAPPRRRAWRRAESSAASRRSRSRASAAR